MVAVNVATFAPEGNVTDAGTVTKLLLLASATEVPPNPAGGSSFTVPIELPPPTTLAGLIVNAETEATGVPHWLGTPPPPHVWFQSEQWNRSPSLWQSRLAAAVNGNHDDLAVAKAIMEALQDTIIVKCPSVRFLP